MKKFHFALDGLVRVREHEMHVQEARVASAAHALQQARDRRAGRGRELEAHLLARPTGVCVDLHSLRIWDENRVEISRRLGREQETVDQWVQRVHAEQHELELAHRRHEAVLKLRERRYLEFMRTLLREEQREADERSGQRLAPNAANAANAGDASSWEREAA